MEKIPLDKNPKTPFYGWQEEDLNKHGHFPWADVFNSRYIGQSTPKQVGHGIMPCPLCLTETVNVGENLVWVYFRSPPWTWEKLCGRAGHLSICTKHKKQVDFICEVMN